MSVPDENPFNRPMTPEEETVFEEGVATGRLLLMANPTHEQHSDPTTIMTCAAVGMFAMIAKGMIPAPLDQEDGRTKMPLVLAFISGMASAYKAAHQEQEGHLLPPTAPSGKPGDDGLPPMFG